MHRKILALAGFVCALVVASGCGNAGPLADVEVESAQLGGLDWSGVDAVVGFSDTPAVLGVVDTAGRQHTVDVDISGPVVGLLMDVAAGDTNKSDCLLQNSGKLALPPGKHLKGSDLVGGYFGSEQAAHLGIGGVSHDLTNPAGVRLTGGAVDLGFGMMVGVEWLSIDAK